MTYVLFLWQGYCISLVFKKTIWSGLQMWVKFRCKWFTEKHPYLDLAEGILLFLPLFPSQPYWWHQLSAIATWNIKGKRVTETQIQYFPIILGLFFHESLLDMINGTIQWQCQLVQRNISIIKCCTSLTSYLVCNRILCHSKRSIMPHLHVLVS